MTGRDLLVRTIQGQAKAGCRNARERLLPRQARMSSRAYGHSPDEGALGGQRPSVKGNRWNDCAAGGNAMSLQNFADSTADR